jgi:acyl-CoA synthetase (AMP-forming)/AMP-acid ligase II
LTTILAVGSDLPGVERWEAAVAAQRDIPIPDEAPGQPMIYSSGTTGKPKGIRLPDLTGDIAQPHSFEAWHRDFYGIDEHSVFLSPAPLYHTAPLMFCLAEHRLGATVVLMPRFDAETLLITIARYKVTHAQLVPTMFVRLLKLPEETRAKYDLSSLQCVVHAGAPCPPEVKRAMIDWLGPIVHEYYGGTEGFGRTCISATEWLERPGSVGRPTIGRLHICGEDGIELPVGGEGMIYFESEVPSVYHNDPTKTAEARHPLHPQWRTFGDIGHVDAQGYLTLTDRKAFTIISGGVNIYPQEAEDILVLHPAVADAAVFGVPDGEMGEQVKAVIQLADSFEASAAMEADLIDWCRMRLSHYKCPRSVDFEAELPRHATGKLYKRLLRDRYWPEKSA